MNSRAMSIAIAAGLAILLLISCAYIVNERERGVLLRFGELIKPDLQPGLHFKLPLIDKVRIFDGRTQSLEIPQARFMTQEKKAVIVDAFIKWRIKDVKAFYRATSGDKRRASDLLSRRAESSLRDKFGSLTLKEVVSGQRDEMMTHITKSLNANSTRLGLEVIDVRVKKIDLPPQVSDSVFQRMASEREKEAQEYRSRGKEIAETIKASADRQRTVLMAEAYKDAEKNRGLGDAKAADIYASAYKKNAEFYAFYHRLEAYKDSFSNKSDILLLEPDSDFFKYLKGPSTSE